MDQDMSSERDRAVPWTTDEITVLEDVNMESAGSNALHDDGNDSLPDLMELSDSSSESGSVQSSADELEVMMPAVDGGQNTPNLSTSHDPSPAASPFPTLPALQPSMRSNNRRARVEDDEDEERDRRHPSQRPPSSVPAQPQPPPRPNTRIRTTLNLPSLARMGLDQADPLRFFQHLMPQQPQTQQPQTQQPQTQQPQTQRHEASNTSTANSNNPTVAPLPNRPASSAAPTPQVPQNQPHDNDNGPEPETMALFTEILMRLGALGALLGGSMAEPESEDPERAKKLIDGLEEVPIGLVRRLARVGGTDDPDGGRDTMCAICWDQLLDEAGFGKNTATDDDVSSAQSDTSSPQMTESSDPEEQPEELKQPKIVVLPCAHVFHADCLVPWFSRPKQTTCPTCRFNIDPDNLTRTRRPRRPTPMRPAQPNAAADAVPGAQQPAQDANAPSQPTDANANPLPTGNDNPNNGPAGHFIFDTLQVPIVLAAPPIISVNLDGLPNTGNGGLHPADGMQGIPNDIMEQIRARMEERLNDRAGQGNQQPSHDTDGADTDASPPTQPATPVGSPPPQPGPGLQPQSDNDQGTTHSIIFGFDVLVGGPRPEGNMMGVDGRAENGTGRDGDQNWFSMMMRDFERNRNDAPAADAGAAATNTNDLGRNNAGQERPAAGQTQDGAGAPGQGQGFPRFLDMNFGDSVHIASGMGRTVGEAMAQLLSSMTNSENQGPANTNTSTDGETGGNATQNDNTNPGAAEPPTNGPTDENRQGQTENQQNQDGGMFANMTSFPFQMMSQMFGLGSPIRVRRQGQGNDQPSNTDASAASQASQPADNARTPNNAPPSEQGGGVGGTGAPQPNDNNNAADGDEGPFTRFMRNMMAGNVVMADGATGGQTANGAAPPHIHFFPPGFAIRADPPSSTSSNAQQPQKQQWTPPPAPGPTLRERIEKREREVGLRCCDMSCGVGPSDEDPLIVLTTEGMKQLALKPVNFDATKCSHTFHPACLVSAERVALRGADAPMIDDDVEVSCSVCRAVGRVSKMDWEEGVQQLT